MSLSTEATRPSAAPCTSAASFRIAPTAAWHFLGPFLARAVRLLRRMHDARAIQALEPRLARDIGAAVRSDCRPDGFTVDPRPLWGVGLTPQPTATLLPSEPGGRSRRMPRPEPGRPSGAGGARPRSRDEYRR